jgi:hypothetical protein
MFMLVCCGILPNEAVIPGFEKLKSILGSTLAEVETNDPGCEYDDSAILLAAKDATGTGEDMP